MTKINYIPNIIKQENHNIRMIALCHINKKKIPIEFSRKTIIH